MVEDAQKIKNLIKERFLQGLGENLLLLAACGSLGRGNYVPGWSDADLLLVVKTVTAELQKKIFEVKTSLEFEINVDVDPFVISKENLLGDFAMHGKLINYLFFISQIDILLNQGISLPAVGFPEYKRNLFLTVVEYQKAMRKSVMEMKADQTSLRTLYRRNIKLTFLVLKRLMASMETQPNTYSDIIEEMRKISYPQIETLENYNKIRELNLIDTLSYSELEKGVYASFNYFEELTNNILIHEGNRTKGIRS